MIGQTISHYKILEKLGEGGMGVVYKADDTKLRRSVALKFLAPELTRDTEAKKRFIHEAQAASALDHPNIAVVHEIDETADGQVFIAMAIYEGETLQQKIKPVGATHESPLPMDDAINYAIQIAEGLHAAHKKGIVHRDIKSSNIIVTAEGQVKIMDFGLARTSGATKLTKTGATVGTVPYMSPEQARGEKVDHRTDIWSLGVVLYEMITGRLPFKSEYQEAVVYSILNENPPPVTSLRTDVPMELERIVSKALAKDEAERYQHADEIIVDLRKVRGSLITEVRVSKRRRKPVWIAAPILLVVLIGLYYLLPVKGDAERIDSLAVLPLKNMMVDPEQDYFVEGMHEALTANLSKISALKVISRTSAMRYKNTDKAMPEIARELGVTGLIQGSVLREGDQVRISVQLIHGPSDRHLWVRSFDRELRSVFALHSEIAHTIAREVNVVVTSEEAARLASSRPVDQEAYEAYLKGRYYDLREIPETIRKAVEYFEISAQKDPSWAPPYAWLGHMYITHGLALGMSMEESFAKGSEAVRRALAIEDNLSEAHAVLADAKWRYKWDWAGAESGFRRAIMLNPGSETAHLMYAIYLSAMGRHEESVAEIERARELDPVNIDINTTVGNVFYYARQYERAMEQFRKTLELDANYWRTYIGLGWCYLQKGMYEEAIKEFQKGNALRGQSSDETMAYAYAMAGRRSEAFELLEKLKKHGDELAIARIYLGLGEKDLALRWIEKGYEVRNIRLRYLKASPVYDALRSDPRFQNLLRRMNFPE